MSCGGSGAEKTDQAALLRDYRLILVSRGPTSLGWSGRFYLCPLCGYYTDRTKYDECNCGNVTIDVDCCRISIRDCPESQIEVYNAIPKRRGGNRTGKSDPH
jgi:hypothetical protein